MIDVTGALRTFLLANSGVSTLTTDVFGYELDDITMPAKAVVIQPSGGTPLAAGYARIASQRFDLKCYGETPYQAGLLMDAVHDALKQMVRTTVGDALLHCAEFAGGRVNSREPRLEWPFVFESFQVFFAESAVA